MAQTVKGRTMLLSIDGKVMAATTDHTLNLSASTTSINHKDVDGDGKWTAETVDKLSWSASSTAFVCSSLGTDRTGYDALYDKFVEGGDVSVMSNGSGWSEVYRGNAIIESLDLTANVDGEATYTINLRGVGAWAKDASL